MRIIDKMWDHKVFTWLLYTPVLNTSICTYQVVDFVADAFESEKKKQWRTFGTFPTFQNFCGRATITAIALLFWGERKRSQHNEDILLDVKTILYGCFFLNT